MYLYLKTQFLICIWNKTERWESSGGPMLNEKTHFLTFLIKCGRNNRVEKKNDGQSKIFVIKITVSSWPLLQTPPFVFAIKSGYCFAILFFFVYFSQWYYECQVFNKKLYFHFTGNINNEKSSFFIKITVFVFTIANLTIILHIILVLSS